MEKAFLLSACLIFIACGVLVIMKPQCAIDLYKKFFKQFPIIKNISEDHFVGKSSYIIILGVLLIVVGVLGMIPIL